MNNTFKEQLKCITTWGQEIYIGLLLKINTTNLLFRDFTQQRSLSVLLIVVFLSSSGKTRRNRKKKSQQGCRSEKTEVVSQKVKNEL